MGGARRTFGTWKLYHVVIDSLRFGMAKAKEQNQQLTPREKPESRQQLYRFDGGGYAIWRYASMFSANANGKKDLAHEANANGKKDLAHEANKVYAFKKYGRLKEFVSAIVRAVAERLDCDAIVAAPGHTAAETQLQKLFGPIVRRTQETQSRKYNHACDIDFDAESSTIEIADGFNASKILFVDDIATTGKTLAFWREYFTRRGVEYVPFCIGVGKKLNPQPDFDITCPAQSATTTATGADRVAALKSRRNDIGDLPPVSHPRRRARCSRSLALFAETYCSALLDHAPPPKLRAYIDTLQAAIDGAGQVHVRMARGAGKTTFVKCALAWGLATGRLHYAVVFCAAASLSANIISDVWGVFEGDPKFAEDFPEVAFPIAKAGGVAQRFAVQHQHGKRTLIKRSAREINLPVIEGAKSSGGILVGLGAGSRARGLVRGKARPDLVLLDDLQTREDARNATRVRQLSAWVDGDVQGLAGKRALNAVMTSTPIAAGDLSELYADGEAHPEWRVVEFRLLEGEPSAPELWEEYAQLWTEGRRSGDMDFKAATAFYAAHREAMDAGLDVLDPARFDARVETSAIQQAQNRRLTMGAEAFNAEFQLTVKASVETVQITPALVASRLNGFPRGTLPRGTVQAVAFCDVNAGVGITWACVAFGPRGVAAVVDYGRFPGGGVRLVAEGLTEQETQRRIAAGLSEVLRRLLDARLPTIGGNPEKIAAVWIDAGYQRRVVQNVCTVFRQRTGRLVWGAVGVAHDRYNQNGRHVVQRGDGVDHRALEGDRWFAQDADRWRERAQRSWLGEPMQPGSLSLPGNDKREHAEFSEEICSEVLAEKITDARGVSHYFWNARPGAGNHYLDAISGCIAMGAWYRLLDDTAETVSAIRASAIPHVAPLQSPLAGDRAQPRRNTGAPRFSSPRMA